MSDLPSIKLSFSFPFFFLSAAMYLVVKFLFVGKIHVCAHRIPVEIYQCYMNALVPGLPSSVSEFYKNVYFLFFILISPFL